jgi:hypothetical protein
MIPLLIALSYISLVLMKRLRASKPYNPFALCWEEA